MIDLQRETILRLNEARNLPWLKGRKGGRISIDSLRRWSLKGIDGVVLETKKIGATAVTSEEAVLRFCERLSVRNTEAPAPTVKRTREIAQAEMQLNDAGIT